MRPVHLVVAAALGVSVMLAARPAAADRRSFTYTYEYSTMPAGQTAIELYSTQSLPTWKGNGPQDYTLQAEIEHGITDRWDIALYHVFAQSSDPTGETGLKYDEMKVRTRYRVAERGELPVDLLGYLELIKVFGASVYEVEAKVIAARDFGPLTAAVNAIGEIKFDRDANEQALELGWAAGLTYEASPAWRVGVESYGGFEVEATDELAASLGPAVSWGPAPSFWVTGTAGIGLTDAANDLDARIIVGLDL